METTYVEAIRLILIEQGIDTVRVDSMVSRDNKADFLEQPYLTNLQIDYAKDVECLADGYEIGFWEIDKTVRMILRDIIWMNLVSEKIKIIFGYDFYMYIECAQIGLQTELLINRMGLFIEPNIRQREFIIIDQNGDPV